MVSTCGGGSGGCIYWWSRRKEGGGGRASVDGMAQEGRCPNVEVLHLRKREYPDEVERGVLTYSGGMKGTSEV